MEILEILSIQPILLLSKALKLNGIYKHWWLTWTLSLKIDIVRPYIIEMFPSAHRNFNSIKTFSKKCDQKVNSKRMIAI